jgi:cell division topological specificity factor
MKFADLFGRQRSATTAHHRLQVLLMHERCGGNPDLIPILREDILAAINKHVAVDPDKVRLTIDRGEMVSLLEIDIEIPIQLKHHCRYRARLSGHLGKEHFDGAGAKEQQIQAHPGCRGANFTKPVGYR